MESGYYIGSPGLLKVKKQSLEGIDGFTMIAIDENGINPLGWMPTNDFKRMLFELAIMAYES